MAKKISPKLSCVFVKGCEYTAFVDLYATCLVSSHTYFCFGKERLTLLPKFRSIVNFKPVLVERDRALNIRELVSTDTLTYKVKVRAL